VVRGSGRNQYRSVVRFVDDDWGVALAGSTCACPVGGDCKHVAALLLQCRAAAGQRRPAPSVGVGRPSRPAPIPGWKVALQRLPRAGGAPVPASADASTVALGLQVRVDGLTPSAGGRARDEVAISIRPVKRPGGGSWSGGYEVSWDAMARTGYGTRFDPAVREWFAELAAMCRSRRYGYASGSEWAGLGEFVPRLVWPHLARAVALGIPVVGAPKRDVVTVAS
jgi:hypothetical protein